MDALVDVLDPRIGDRRKRRAGGIEVPSLASPEARLPLPPVSTRGSPGARDRLLNDASGLPLCPAAHEQGVAFESRKLMYAGCGFAPASHPTPPPPR